jgi:hypothetical protein
MIKERILKPKGTWAHGHMEWGWTIIFELLFKKLKLRVIAIILNS